MLCENCKKREECVELCGKVLEYIDPERLPGDFIRQMQDNPDRWPIPGGSKKYQIAAMYFLDHKTECVIAAHFHVSQQYVSKIVMRVKKFMEEI